MIWAVLLYILPAVVNLIFLRDLDEFLSEETECSESDIQYAYCILTFLPVVNFLVFLYIILTYVFKSPRKD